MEEIKDIKFTKFFGQNNGARYIPEGTWTTGALSTGKKKYEGGKFKQETIKFLVDGKVNTGIDTQARYNLIGHYENSNYGNQFIVQKMQMILDTKTLEGLAQALKLIMSPLMAERMLEHFGEAEKVIEAFENKCSKEFMEIKGMTEEKLENYYELFDEKISGQEAIMKLTPLGFTPTQAKSVYNKYKDMELIMKMLEDAGMYDFYLDGALKLHEAETIADSLGIDLLNEKRIGALIVGFYKQPFQDDSFFTDEQMNTFIVPYLVKKCGEGLNQKHYNSALSYLRFKDATHRAEDKTGLRIVHDTEFGIYRAINELNSDLKSRVHVPDDLIERVISHAPFQLSEEQIEAVRIACTNGLSIISGNAGSGKSTTLGIITKIFNEMRYGIEQVALSGKAALRIKETTGLPAQTIHRMFALKHGVIDIGNPYVDLSEVEFNNDVLILDEASMVGGAIMLNLLRLLAKSKVKHVIIVGDDAQLPPIGTGQAFTDLLNYCNIPKKKLTKVYRQASESGILAAATMVRKHENFIPYTEEFGQDFKYLHSAKGSEIVAEFDRMLKRNKGDVLETQIISMTNLEVTQVSVAIQRHLNVYSERYYKSKERGIDYYIFEGSKVMVSENQYETLTYEGEEGGHPVFNGNIGIVKSINDEYMIIDFTGIGKVGILKENWKALRLGYAITIHKSQGSGFNSVIALVSDSIQDMLTSNMLYTAITRAKEECTLVSRDYVVDKCVNSSAAERQTWLPIFYGGKQ